MVDWRGQNMIVSKISETVCYLVWIHQKLADPNSRLHVYGDLPLHVYWKLVKFFRNACIWYLDVYPSPSPVLYKWLLSVSYNSSEIYITLGLRRLPSPNWKKRKQCYYVYTFSRIFIHLQKFSSYTLKLIGYSFVSGECLMLIWFM